MEKTFKIERLIDENIKVGDIVRLYDGSALSCDKFPEKDIFVVYDYEFITGLKQPLKELDAVVLETGLYDYVMPFEIIGKAYLQDITVQIGTGIFRTASSLVRHATEVIDFPYDDFEEEGL